MKPKNEAKLKTYYTPGVCEFCGKEFSNQNGLIQHRIRCKLNPNRKDYDHLSNYASTNLKGKTARNCASIAKQRQAVIQKYKNGYVSPIKGRTVTIDYLWKEHNEQEILKWLNYIESIQVNIPAYSTINGPAGYKVLAKTYTKAGSTVKLYFEQNHIANYLLSGLLKEENVVHHIDSVRDNNTVTNLMVFADRTSHKRWHGDKCSYLIYDDTSHLFTTIIRNE